MSRRGFTLIEALVAGSIGVIIFGAAVAVWMNGSKMAKAGQSSASITSIVLLQGQLTEDLCQLVPNLQNGQVMKIQPGGFAFYRGVITRGQNTGVTLRPMAYYLTPSPAKNAFLMRMDGKSVRQVPNVVLTSVGFSLINTLAQRFLRMEALLLDSDEAVYDKGAFSARSQPMVLLLPLPQAGGMGNPFLSKAMPNPVIEGPLPF